jgi:branched-chain amino acid transport system substrate-binding protein
MSPPHLALAERGSLVCGDGPIRTGGRPSKTTEREDRMTKPRRGSGRALAAALIAAPLLAGAAAAQGISDGAVRIGILNDQSGVYAEFGGRSSIEAARMAIEDFGGSVNGAPVELVSADHQNKADIASGIARQWYDRDKVDAIMELTTSSVALAVQGLSKEKKRITITTGAATSDLTGKQCSPYGYHWAYDTRALAVGTGGALVQQGGNTWFMLTADYAFGHSLEAEVTRYVTSKGGKIVGGVRHPLAAQDYSSFLLQAQGSGAKVIGLANAGLDTSNSIKQASEYGITQGGQRLAALLFTLAEVHGLGLQVAQGLTLTEGWYWDLNDETRAFGQRFMKRTGKMPNMVHTGTYSAVLQYLKAVKAAGTDETEAVNAKLRTMPVEDVFAKNGTVLPNGRMVHDMYLFEVKKPAESKGPWDLYRLLATIPGAEAYAKLEESGCALTAASR